MFLEKVIGAIMWLRHLVYKKGCNVPYSPLFQEKTTEAASLLLRLSGGRMSYMKLVKLLYFADRKALEEWERSITYDNFSSLPRGPVGSSTLNLAKGIYPNSEYWDHFIEKDGVDVKIRGKYPKIKKLSPAEVELIKAIFKELGKYDQWQLAKMSEELPEWKNPHGSSLPIELPELLMFLEYSPEDAERIVFEFQEESILDNLFGA